MALATFLSERRRPVMRSSQTSRPSAVAARTQVEVSSGEATIAPSGTFQSGVSRLAFMRPGRAPVRSEPPRNIVHGD